MNEYEVLDMTVIIFEENDIITESQQGARDIEFPWVDDE